MEDVTPLVVVASVVATCAVYVFAAWQALNGVVPGAYVSLLFLAPFGLMASYLPFFLTVVRVVVPNFTALALIAASAASVMAFQSAVVSGRLGAVIALAIVNLCLFVAAAYAQMGLSVEGASRAYERRKRLALTLSQASR